VGDKRGFFVFDVLTIEVYRYRFEIVFYVEIDGDNRGMGRISTVCRPIDFEPSAFDFRWFRRTTSITQSVEKFSNRRLRDSLKRPPWLEGIEKKFSIGRCSVPITASDLKIQYPIQLDERFQTNYNLPP